MKYDFEVRAGNTGTVKNEMGLELVLKAGSPPSAIDLSDSEFVFVVRAAVNRPPVLRKTSQPGGGITIDPVAGRVLVALSASENRSLWGGATGARVLLQYELERRRPQSQRAVLFGSLTVLPGMNDD